MEIKWEKIYVCAPDGFDPDAELNDPREHDYWEVWETVLETIIGASTYYTIEANQDVPEEEQKIYQMVVRFPIEWMDWEEDEERE